MKNIMNDILAELGSIEKNKLIELKAYANPPRIVGDVLESVLILLKKDSSLQEAKRLLGKFFSNYFLNFQN